MLTDFTDIQYLDFQIFLIKKFNCSFERVLDLKVKQYKEFQYTLHLASLNVTILHNHSTDNKIKKLTLVQLY